MNISPTSFWSDSRFCSRSVALLLGISFSLTGIDLLDAQHSITFSNSGGQLPVNKISARLDVRGDLRVNTDGKAVTTIPMIVAGRLNYVERRLHATRSPESKAIKTIRNYELARADIRIGQGSTSSSLDTKAGLIVVNCKDVSTQAKTKSEHDGVDRVEFHRIGEVVTSDEIDLINIPGNTAIINDLLNVKGVTRIGQAWKVDSELLASFLTIEAISQSDVELRLTRLTDGQAIVLMSGKISGAVSGVATEIDLNGVLNYDIDERQVSRLDLTIQENRSIGHAEPGFRVAAKLLVENSRCRDAGRTFG